MSSQRNEGLAEVRSDEEAGPTYSTDYYLVERCTLTAVLIMDEMTDVRECLAKIGE